MRSFLGALQHLENPKASARLTIAYVTRQGHPRCTRSSSTGFSNSSRVRWTGQGLWRRSPERLREVHGAQQGLPCFRRGPHVTLALGVRLRPVHEHQGSHQGVDRH
jgi:hypothetical protein